MIDPTRVDSAAKLHTVSCWPASFLDHLEQSMGLPIIDSSPVQDPDCDGVVIFFGEDSETAVLIVYSKLDPCDPDILQKPESKRAIWLYEDIVFIPAESEQLSWCKFWMVKGKAESINCDEPEDDSQTPR